METVKDLIGLVFESVIWETIRGDDVIVFKHKNGDIYKLYHDRDCCESVTVDTIKGNLNTLIDAAILDVVEENPDLPPLDSNYDDSHTWTRYLFTTTKGTVEILWYGTSNGYYSESVNFCKIPKT